MRAARARQHDGLAEQPRECHLRGIVEAEAPEAEHAVGLERLETGLGDGRIQQRRSVQADHLGADGAADRLDAQCSSHGGLLPYLARCAARARSTSFSTLPAAFTGSASTNSTARGTL